MKQSEINRAYRLGLDGSRRCVGHWLGIAGNPTNAPQELVDAYARGYQEGKKRNEYSRI